MILELDCGNTRVKWRLCQSGVVRLRGAFPSGEGFHPDTVNTLVASGIERVLVGSVLGDDYARKLAQWSLAHLNVNPEFALSEPSCCGVVNGYQQPERLGVDRWLAILAAKSSVASAVVLVDCGSAITVDVVTSQGEHLGGYIAPGLRLMRDALGANTAVIKLNQIGYPEDDFPGRNTVAAIKSAELAMVLGLIERAQNVLRHYDNDIALYLTGGDGEWLLAHLDNARYVEDLVMDGLRMALKA